MGGTKKIRRKYQGPAHLWQRARIDEEKQYSKDYGLKNKKEIWKMTSLLAKFKRLAKIFIAAKGKQAQVEAEQLVNRLKSLGLLNDTSVLSDVLVLTTKDIMEKRLQTVVFRMGHARTINQARQFIVHGHIKVGGRKIASPSYMVKKGEENTISFSQTSSFADKDHPERIIKATPKAAEKATTHDTKGDGRHRFDRNSRQHGQRRHFDRKDDRKSSHRPEQKK